MYSPYGRDEEPMLHDAVKAVAYDMEPTAIAERADRIRAIDIELTAIDDKRMGLMKQRAELAAQLANDIKALHALIESH